MLNAYLHKIIADAESIYFDSNNYSININGASRYATESELLAAKRAQIIEQINAERDRRTTLGVAYTWPDGLVGSIQTRDQTDITNMTGQVLAATLLTMQGMTDPVLWFIDGSNVRHDLTPAQMIAAGFAMQGALSAIIDFARSLKDQVLVAADPESIDILTGWPE